MAADPSTLPSPFRNEPLLDYSRPEDNRQLEAALDRVRSQLGRTHGLVIGGRAVTTAETFESLNPAHPGQVIGRFAKAGVDHVDQAVEAAWAAFPAWSEEDASRRAGLLLRLAEAMRRERLELTAWLMLEVGKNRREAVADVAEAIDFCEFYARDALRLAGPQPLTEVPGERNHLEYLPLGAGAVVPPWNFPLAILCGMTVAAVVTGNTVVLKPSSDSPAIAWQFVRLLEGEGLPPGVVNLITGPGAAIGDRLVDHPRIRFIAFTGSKEVGLRINERAARPAPGQRWIKRVVVEMGGKDAIVVDREADLDAAAEGVVASAFGFQGQKCSACSRVIVDAAVHDAFLDRLKTLVAALPVGPPEEADKVVGPLINARARDKVLSYVERGRSEGKHLVGGEALPGEGYYVTPAVFYDLPRDGALAQEEIFGPVLAVLRARDLDDALAVANDTEYGLTGAVYSNDPEALEKARRRFFVGNLYVNRKCTGALVGAHPFGGFNMSGTDSKAGGHDYLLLFLQARVVAEKVK